MLRGMDETDTDPTGPAASGTPPDEPLAGHLLIAMPSMQDPRFHRTVIYLCAHSEEGAMGLIVNKPAETLALGDLLERLGIPAEGVGDEVVRFGGPVETGRGFVLHSAEYESEGATLKVDGTVSMTATLDILHAMAEGRGPRRRLVALGYAGWGPGQLESEIRANAWLVGAADPALVFDAANETKWARALAAIGVDPSLLSAGGSA